MVSKTTRCAIAATAFVLLVRPSLAQQGAAAQELQGFSIVLVQATSVPGSDSTLPAAARRAIADMKDVLPFRSYQLLDSAWILSSTDLMRARLRGPDGVDYNVAVETSPASAGNRRVAFSLREVGARPVIEDVARDQAALLERHEAQQMTLIEALRAAGGKAETGQKRDGDQTVEFLRAQLADTERRLAEMNRHAAEQARVETAARAARVQLLRQEVQRLEDELSRLKERLLDRHPDIVRRTAQLENVRQDLAKREADAQKVSRPVASTRLQPEGAVIDTTFTIGLGETVVVGTSRVRGDTAVVVVLTAVPQSRGRGAF